MTVHRVDQGMAVAAARSLPDNVDKELRTRYRQLRVMLHTAGLAATYAYIASKAGDGVDETTPDSADKLAGPTEMRLRVSGRGWPTWACSPAMFGRWVCGNS